MQGTTLTFQQRTETGRDAFNNPTFSRVDIIVEDCLIAPISEPASAREQQAINQDRDQVRIHLPKTFTGDVSGSQVVWDGKLFELDSDSVVFMAANTPTRWNRYFRAEFVSNYQAVNTDGFFPVYWGTNANPSLNASQVVALQDLGSLNQLPLSFDIDGEGEYIYFAYPIHFTVAKVFVNGFWVTDWEISQLEVDNVAGLNDYYVYRSHYKQHGNGIQIEVAKTP